MADGERGVSIITDHPFTPRAEWWTVCKVCALAEAAHVATTLGGHDDDANTRNGRERERDEALRRTLP